VFTPAGAVAAVVRVPGVNGASRPTGLAVDHESKSLLVTDLDGARVLELPLFQGTR
jgi:hypothetical protein